MKSNCVIAIKSTVLPGTTADIINFIQQQNPNLSIQLAANPEFLREGSAINDFYNPDRIVIGTNSLLAKEKLTILYEYFIKKNIPIVWTNPETAELIKYAANSFLATKITYINEMANICEKTKANIKDLIQGIGLDQRIGTHFLQPGPGFGGSCFPKDIKAFSKFTTDINMPSSIINAVISSNEHRKQLVINKINQACNGTIHQKTIGILGITFKANTDDIRNSPALGIVTELLNQNVYIKIFDPAGMDNARKILSNKNILWCDNIYDVAQSSNALVITTEWNDFKTIEPMKIKQKMASPVVIDLRNILDPKIFKENGFFYQGVGL